MDFDVLHYYIKFLNNKFIHFRENIKECTLFLDSIFSKMNHVAIMRMFLDSNLLTGDNPDTFLNTAFQKIGELNLNKVLSSYDLDITFRPEDFIYTFNNIDRDADWSWVLSSLKEDSFFDLAHKFYTGNIFNFNILKNTLVEDFYLGNLLLKVGKAPAFALSDIFLKTVEERFEDTLTLDCQIVSESDLPFGYPRLLTTDQVLVIPSETPLRFLVTSNDVIHS